MLWSKELLHQLIEEQLQGRKLLVVSNREPFMHRYRDDGSVECITTTGGLATALRPILAASGGTWIAHGAGKADRTACDEHGRLPVPPEQPSYTLRRVFLTKEQELGHYYGLSNEGLWPLCHISFTRPVFRLPDWERYREVNRLFADVVLEEAGDEPTFVFIQDYHFCLLPRMLKASGKPNMVIAQFWHIPWPAPEIFRVFPWSRELLDGLLGNDLLGFHTRQHCQNFLDTTERGLESLVNRESWVVTRGGLETQVRPFPISIDFEGQQTLAASAEVERAMEIWKRRLRLPEGAVIGAGIERLDYTKGIPDRLRALDLFFERHPEWIGSLSFVQVAVPSRSRLPAYQAVEQEMEKLAEEINWRWGSREWQPLILIPRQQSGAEMAALHRLSDFFIVNSLHDGMNLVAKEYCASRIDEGGMLILSRFTGAARELTDALGVNPFAAHEMADAIHTAITMPAAERSQRMRRMRTVIQYNNVYRWAGKILANLLHFDLPDHDAGNDADTLD